MQILCFLLIFAKATAVLASTDAERQALGQDLIHCAAFRSYQKLCLKVDAGADHADEMQALTKSAQAFLTSAWALLLEYDLVFPEYDRKMEQIRAACKGQCTDLARMSAEEYSNCTAYEQARTDPRNPWRH